MVQDRSTAPLVLWRIMVQEGCTEWELMPNGSAFIVHPSRNGGVAYSRLVRAEELADTLANRVAGDIRQGV